MSVAKRVSEETDTLLGEFVGYQIRFQDNTCSKTQLIFQTDGMLIRELMIDQNLSKYSYIFIDEAHERTLNTDILFGVLKLLVEK